MATFYSNMSNTYRLRYEVTPQAPDITNNRTTVKLELYIENGSQWMDQRLSAWMEANGTRQGTITDTTWAIPPAQTANRSTRLFSTTETVNHNSDGTKTISLKAYLKPTTVYTWSPQTSLEINTSLVLPTIPRASTITTFNSFATTDSTITATVARASTSFTHTFIMDVKKSTTWVNVKTVTGVATSTNMALTSSQQNIIHNAVTNSDRATVRLTVVTYNGSTEIGSTSKEVTAIIPGTLGPSIETLTITDMTSSSAQLGVYVRLVSRLKLQVLASAGSGATITNYRFHSKAFTTMSGSSSSQTMAGTLQAAGFQPITVSVTDSRGRTASREFSIQILDYDIPKIHKLTAYRASSSTGTPEPFGTNAYVSWSISVSSVKVSPTSPELNSGKRQLFIQEVPYGFNSESISNFNPPSNNGNKYLSSTTSDRFPTNKEFNLMLQVSDKFNTINSVVPIPVGQVPFSIGKEGIGAGQVTTDNYNLEVGEKGIDSKGNITAPNIILPRGDVNAHFNTLYSITDDAGDSINLLNTKVANLESSMPKFITLTSDRTYGTGANYIRVRILIPLEYRSNKGIIPNWRTNAPLMPYIAYQTNTSTFDVQFYKYDYGTIGTGEWAETKITIIY